MLVRNAVALARKRLHTHPRRLMSVSTALRSSNPNVEEVVDHPEGRSYEPTEVLRARLRYTSRKRGILETGLLLGSYASKHLPTMDDAQLREYDLLLTTPDWTLLYWCTGAVKPPPEWESSPILASLQEHVKSRTALRMPDL